MQGVILSKESEKYIKCYCSYTNKGIIKSVNEDKVVAMTQIKQPAMDVNNVINFKKWPSNLSFFGVYDGHGGSRASEYL